MKRSDAGRSARAQARKYTRLSAPRLITTPLVAVPVSAALVLLLGWAAFDLVFGLFFAAIAAAAAWLLLPAPDARTRAQARAQAGAWEAGARGEEATGVILQTLATTLQNTATSLHDRLIRGSESNIDHAYFPAIGGVIAVINSKQWRREWLTREVNGALKCGNRDQSRDVNSLVYEARRVAEKFPGARIIRVIAVHGSTVEELHQKLMVPEKCPDGVVKVPVHVVAGEHLAEWLHSLERLHQVGPDCTPTHELAARFAAHFPRYRPCLPVRAWRRLTSWRR